MESITGIAEANISSIENDHLEIGVKRAALFAAAFGVEPSLILFPEGYKYSFYKEIVRTEKKAAKIINKKKVG